ncbi:MAG: DinB family protein, partial [Promethearchaeota archaeon]
MKRIFLELANMNAWANACLRQTIQNLPLEVLASHTYYTPFGSLGNLVIHIFNTINTWLDRLEGKRQSPLFNLDDFENWSDVLAAWESADERFMQLVKELPEDYNFKRVIQYTSYRGIEFESPLDEILLHVSHHGFHHRGQIALLLRLEEQQPAPQLDAIVY